MSEEKRKCAVFVVVVVFGLKSIRENDRLLPVPLSLCFVLLPDDLRRKTTNWN